MGELREWVGGRVARLGPEGGDAVLYAASAAFAAVTAGLSTIALYRVWAEIAIGPYVAAAVASLFLLWWRRRRAVAAADAGSPGGAGRRSHWRGARIWLFVAVLVGATLAPLSVEVALRNGGSAGTSSAHVQPEVVVIDQAARRIADGKSPYQAVPDKHGHVDGAPPGEPAYEAFFPYLPLMAVFGLPSDTHHPIRLTDARIFFSLVTLLVAAGALALCRAPTERKVRALQVLAVLPTAALPLATGGDDMPIVAILLLGMVLAQRRQPFTSGLVLGVVSAMKFTAWPLAALALFAARDRDGRRQPLRMLLGMLVVIGPVVVPYLLKNVHAFVVNVILFPLGLASVASPAASPLPGHLLVTAFPPIHRALPVVVAVVGGAALVRYLVRRTPSAASQVTALAAWVMLVAILFAPATRIGYLLYPVNFFVWAFMLKGAEQRDLVAAPAAGPTAALVT
ncbi:MAG TPA: glycosyltransferase 87 family protein [Acidimicrobiales bacterium]|nr:glycosyltransferase 87 family protein [Acidimicrobiales bacterium]